MSDSTNDMSGAEQSGVGRGRRRPRPAKIVMMLAFAALAAGAVGLVVMALWNALIPAIFGGSAVTWLQALGLFALGRILFGGWGRGRMGGGRHWRKRMDDRMASLSPEERERMKAMMSRRFGPGCRGSNEAAGTGG